MNPDFTLIWPLSCPKDGDHFSHSSLGYPTPAEFKAQLSAGSDDGGRSPAMPARADQEEYGHARRTFAGAVLQ